MKESAQIEAMARLEGLSKVYTDEDGTTCGYILGNRSFSETRIRIAPDYLHDHNAVQRVIDGFDDLTADDYMYKLDTLINGIGLWAGSVANAKLARATCHQKVEAILKACGKWSDGNDGGEIV